MATALDVPEEVFPSSPLKPLCFPEVKSDLSSFYNPDNDMPIPCMFCDSIFDKTSSPKGDGKECRQMFLHHIFKEHRLVINKTTDITSYRCYSMYWKVRFKERDINSILPVIRTNPETLKDSPELFYLLSDDCAEDKQLRKFLQRKRLEALLEVQHKERKEDVPTDHQCLFCSDVIHGKRSIIFNHMLTSHNFNIGQPNNLVFVDEFLKTLRIKLENLQCLYCERKFRDTSTLKDHMRKKQHRKINPSNTVYDKYYMINYLEIGKTWQEILSEDDKEIGEHAKDKNEENEDSDEEDEVSGSGISYDVSCPLVCLFCTISVTSKGKLLQHMKESHGFDLSKIMADLKDDFYGQIKLINYIRRVMYEKKCIYCQVTYSELSALINHMTVTCHFQLPQRSEWDQPQYLFPTYENDGLLCILEDFES